MNTFEYVFNSRLRIVSGTHYRRNQQGQLLPPTGSTWSGPLSPAPGRTMSDATRQLIINRGYLYMSFTQTSGNNVRWNKFVPIFNEYTTFDLHRFEYKVGSPLFDWKESWEEERVREIPRWEVWLEEDETYYTWQFDTNILTTPIQTPEPTPTPTRPPSQIPDPTPDNTQRPVPIPSTPDTNHRPSLPTLPPTGAASNFILPSIGAFLVSIGSIIKYRKSKKF